LAPRVRGQVIAIGGIDSNLVDAQGGSIRMWLPNSESMLSFGMVQGKLEEGFSEATTIGGFRVVAGDQFMSAPLASDFASSSGYGFEGRGISVERDRQNLDRTFAFVGSSAITYGLPELSAANTDGGTRFGLFSYDRKLGHGLSFDTLEVASNRETAIQSLSWVPRPDLLLACSAGLGNGDRYASVLLNVRRKRAALRVAYGLVGRDFRVVAIPNQLTIANTGLNASGSFLPWSWLNVSGSRTQYAEPTVQEGHSTVNSGGLTEHFKVLDFQEEAFAGDALGRHSTGEEAGVGINWNRISVHSSWYASSGYAPVLFNAVSYHVSQRLQLSSYVTRSQGKTSVNWGGMWSGNLLSISVGYSEEFFPLVGASKSPFASVLSVSVSLHAKDVNVTVSTIETPNQSMRWGVFGGTYLYGPISAESSNRGKTLGGKYILSGVVMDADGAPVQGAAIAVTNKKGKSAVAWSDSQGRWSTRVRKIEDYDVAVSLDDFTAPEVYVVRECPATAKSGREGQTETIHVVLFRQ
jgi:hypothetical protein